MIKKFLNVKTILLIISGIAIGAVLFAMGDADDAPGLSAIGLGLAFLLIMRGVYTAQALKKGCCIPIVAIVFGLAFVVLPVMLLLDGEIASLSAVYCIVMIAGAFMIISAVSKLIKLWKN